MWGGELPGEWHHFLGQVILSYVRMEEVSWALTGVRACLLPLLFGCGVLCASDFFCCDFAASIDRNLELRANKFLSPPSFFNKDILSQQQKEVVSIPQLVAFEGLTRWVVMWIG